MEFRDFTCGKDDDGRRLDRILRIFLKDKSLGQIYKLIRKGLIKVNHNKTKPELHIKEGDLISIASFLLENTDGYDNPDIKKSASPSGDLQIVFQNQHLLVINKPYGRSVHGSEKDSASGLDKEVLFYYEKNIKASKEASLAFRPGPLHRLDRNTSGLLVFSLSLEGAKWFSDSIKNHTVQKKYLGLAEGKLEQSEIWEDSIKDSEQNAENSEGFYTVTRAQTDEGKKAVTIAKPLAYVLLDKREFTLVEYTIKTGRKHQIRLQSQLHKHPLAGDKAYGGKGCGELKREYYLHAYSLSFPKDNPLELPLEVKSPLPKDFKELLSECELSNCEMSSCEIENLGL